MRTDTREKLGNLYNKRTYSFTDRAPKYMKQNQKELKGKIK